MRTGEIHTPEGKAEFICDLMNNIRDNMLTHVKDMPGEWDGHELRLYITGKVKRGADSNLAYETRSKRYKSFINELIVRNL